MQNQDIYEKLDGESSANNTPNGDDQRSAFFSGVFQIGKRSDYYYLVKIKLKSDAHLIYNNKKI